MLFPPLKPLLLSLEIALTVYLTLGVIGSYLRDGLSVELVVFMALPVYLIWGTVRSFQFYRENRGYLRTRRQLEQAVRALPRKHILAWPEDDGIAYLSRLFITTTSLRILRPIEGIVHVKYYDFTPGIVPLSGGERILENLEKLSWRETMKQYLASARYEKSGLSFVSIAEMEELIGLLRRTEPM